MTFSAIVNPTRLNRKLPYLGHFHCISRIKMSSHLRHDMMMVMMHRYTSVGFLSHALPKFFKFPIQCVMLLIYISGPELHHTYQSSRRINFSPVWWLSYIRHMEILAAGIKKWVNLHSFFYCSVFDDQTTLILPPTFYFQTASSYHSLFLYI